MKLPKLPKNRFLRFGARVGLACCLLFTFLLVRRQWIFHDSAAKLREITDRLDADEPGWRLGGRRIADTEVSDGENGWLKLERLLHEVPRTTDRFQWAVPTAWPLPAADRTAYLADVREQLSHWQATLSASQGVADFPHARMIGDLIGPLDSDALNERVQKILTVTRLLGADAVYRLVLPDKGTFLRDLKALATAERIIRNGRSGSIESASRYFARLEIRKCIEKLLLLGGSLPPAELAFLEGSVREDETYVLLYQMRVHRAYAFAENGRYIEGREWARPLRVGSERFGFTLPVNGFSRSLEKNRYTPYREADLARMLAFETDEIRQIEADPDAARTFYRRALESGPVPADPPIDQLLSCQMGHRHEPFASHLVNELLRRYLKLLLACERFRIENDRWPKSCEETGSALRNPYTDQPMRIDLWEGGITVSTGVDPASLDFKPKAPRRKGLPPTVAPFGSEEFPEFALQLLTFQIERK